ncbi:MAG TPA: hypothetical protein VK726_16365 [Acetobacteraceae bacterium]|jgi:hypothetical protein|nr:hypothetical protein [Acetobacteraceae bacterium]
MSKRWTAAVALMAICLAVVGCSNGNAPPPVPPLQPEVMGNPPVTPTPLIWQPGHWDWTGGGYSWVAGVYVPSAGHGNLWMPGYWALGEGGGWVWQPAHWM